MPRIKSAPTPETFAKEWTKDFAAAVRSAAGSDGRLSVNEAKKLAEANGMRSLFADNASNFLSAKAQKSVSVDKLIAAGHDYAFALGQKVAGADGRISLADGQKLPADLKADFAYLRGKGLTELNPPSGTDKGLEKKLQSLVKGLVLESSDGARGNLNAVYSKQTTSKPLTPELALQLLGPQWAELKKSIWGSADLDVNNADLGDVTKLRAEKDSGAIFKDNLADSESVAGLNQLNQYLKQELTDVSFIRVGVPENGKLRAGGDFGLLIVGKTRDGHIAGALAGLYIDA